MGDIGQIGKALAEAQAGMKGATKDAKGNFSTYATLASAIDACRGELAKAKISFVQPMGRDEHGPYCDTLLIHESGESLSSRVYLVVAKNDMQGMGSAITYARRYGLMGLVGIAPEDDDGEAAAKAPPPKEKQPKLKQATDAEIDEAIAQIKGCRELGALGNVWSALNANSKHVAAHADVIWAKDTRKAELEAA